MLDLMHELPLTQSASLFTPRPNTRAPLVQSSPVQQQAQHLQRWCRPILLRLGEVQVVDKQRQAVASWRAQAVVL